MTNFLSMNMFYILLISQWTQSILFSKRSTQVGLREKILQAPIRKQKYVPTRGEAGEAHRALSQASI